jgi:peptide-methionine (S)-S-oxide reductase
MTEEVATLAGGCFWCIEAVFQEMEGIESVVSGYSGGHVENPSYRDVCSEITGHTEAIQLTFEPAVTSFREILEVFFTLHDPTTLNRQGNDVGTQYRSAIFHHSPDQESTAREVIAEIEESDIWGAPIVTEVAPFDAFYRAGEAHQSFYRENSMQPYCLFVVRPKVAKFREKFAHKLRR